MRKYQVENDDHSWEEIYYLQSLRKRAGMLQIEVGDKLMRSTSSVSKMENTKPDWWRFLDIIAYADACGYNVEVRFVKKEEEQ